MHFEVTLRSNKTYEHHFSYGLSFIPGPVWIKGDTHLINMRLTLGINDWWDVSFEPSIVKRCMNWQMEEESVHHRTECSESDYYNNHGDLQSRGGYLGDFQVKARYLFKNTGKGSGSRIFFETGFIIPSRNTLVTTPFINEEDHRHFAVSDGVYKGVFGIDVSCPLFCDKHQTCQICCTTLVNPSANLCPSQTEEFAILSRSSARKCSSFSMSLARLTANST